MTCLQRPLKVCAEKASIEKHHSRQELLVVYGYDWSSDGQGPEVIARLCEQAVGDTKRKYMMPKIMFKRLSGESGSIFCRVCKEIQKADIAIFDVSTHNPNVLLELGMATGCGTKTYVCRCEGITAPETSLSDLRDVFEYRYRVANGNLVFTQQDLGPELRTRLDRMAKERDTKLRQMNREARRKGGVVLS